MNRYREELGQKKVAVVIYFVLFIYFIIQVNYYDNNIGGFPDEGRHLAYVTYLEITDTIIPDFYNMPDTITSEADGTFSMEGINYLGHPPLYYNILNFFTDITGDGIIDDTDTDNLRAVSQVIAYIGIIAAFGYGLMKFNKNVLHLLFGTIMISVPMLSYTVAGVNNDTLAFTGMILFFIAIERLVVKREGWFTYLLFALTVAIVMLTKVTASIILVLTCLVVFLYIMIKERSVKLLWNKYFLVTIPIYLIVVAYYLYIYSLFGSFQPTLQAIDYEYFMTTIYYTDVDERVVMSFSEYISYFIRKFMESWTGISSHVLLLKTGAYTRVQQIGLSALLVAPILGIVSRNKTPQIKIMMVTYIATIITIVVQTMSSYSSFLERGYLGGFQSRYYLCALIAFAFLICHFIYEHYRFFLSNYREKTRVVEAVFTIVCVVWSVVLLYEDFIYFIIYYI